MSRFDDELRHAASDLASEPLPDDLLHDALEAPPAALRWPAAAAAIVAGALLVIIAGIGIGQVRPGPSAEPSTSTSPSGGPVACEDVAAPVGGADIVLVFFPCGTDLASGTRSVDAGVEPSLRLERALRHLLTGPTPTELAAGMTQIVPPGSDALLAAVSLAPDGLATLEFDAALREVDNLSTSLLGGSFMRAVRETAFQFDEVTAIELRLAGSCDDFFAHFQATCQHFAKPIPAAGDCPIIAPAELPSGAPITEPRAYPGEAMVSWGSGSDTVTELAGHRDGGPAAPSDAVPVEIRGEDGYVIPIGDTPGSEVELGWVETGCPYRVWIRLGDGIEAAIAYARRFGPAVALPPSPPTVEPVTRSVEEQGIRFTVTLDRDRTTHGQLVTAVATIENVGTGSVFWGHSGTCAYPATMTARSERPTVLTHGRDDWPGDLGILKLTTVEEGISVGEAQHRFIPEEWLGLEGIGCTSDLVMSELPAGDELVQRLVWDTQGYYDMPPQPGAYTVEAVFQYMSRGEPPGMDEEVDIDEFALSVSLPLTVDGPEVDYVSPGEAVDAALGDEEFRGLLEDIPRSDWLGTHLEFTGDRWEVVLFHADRVDELDPLEEMDALVATIDASSGAVLRVEEERRPRPPGG